MAAVEQHVPRIELWSGTIKGEDHPTWFIDLWEPEGCCALGDSPNFYIAMFDAEDAARSWGYPLTVIGEAP